MGKSPKRLGRGLSSLISADLSGDEDAPGTQKRLQKDLAARPLLHSGHRVLSIPVDEIRPNPTQPRNVFDDSSLQALAESLNECGALQPILVRASGTGYEVVAGERRLRAAKIAGMNQIPAIVKSVSDDNLLETALIENVQRTDLNPIERARGYRALHERHGLSHDAIAKKMGEDRATVANYIRLLGLGDDAVAMIASGALSTGHGKALLAVSDPKTQVDLATAAARDGWSVRRLEATIQRKREPSGRSRKPASRRPAVQEMEQRLAAAVGTRVVVREGRKRHSGSITIEYYSLDDFERIASILGVAPEGPA